MRSRQKIKRPSLLHLKEMCDMLLKTIGYGSYSDGTFALLLVPLHKPIEGETLEQANGPESDPITHSEVMNVLQNLTNKGFCLIAEKAKAPEAKLDSGIILS